MTPKLEIALPVGVPSVGEIPSERNPANAADDPAHRFQALAKQWKQETKFHSNVTKRCVHRAYQQIIAMGQTAVPLILADLAANGPDDWFWALSVITDEDPIQAEFAGNMNEMTEAWLQWEAAKGYRNDFRPTTSMAL